MFSTSVRSRTSAALYSIASSAKIWFSLYWARSCRQVDVLLVLEEFSTKSGNLHRSTTDRPVRFAFLMGRSTIHNHKILISLCYENIICLLHRPVSCLLDLITDCLCCKRYFIVYFGLYRCTNRAQQHQQTLLSSIHIIPILIYNINNEFCKDIGIHWSSK